MKCITEVERHDNNCTIWTVQANANTDINHLTTFKANT